MKNQGEEKKYKCKKTQEIDAILRLESGELIPYIADLMGLFISWINSLYCWFDGPIYFFRGY